MQRCLFVYVHLCTHTDHLSLISEGVSQRKKCNLFKLWGREQCISCELSVVKTKNYNGAFIFQVELKSYVKVFLKELSNLG